MGSRRRTQRIASVIQEELGRLLTQEVSDPALHFLNISDVDVTGDLRMARIYYTAAETAPLKDIEKGLKRALPFLRRKIGQNLSLRNVPELEFFYDNHSLKVAKLFTLMESLPKPLYEAKAEAAAAASSPAPVDGGVL